MTAAVFNQIGRLKTVQAASISTGGGTDVFTATQNGKETILEILLSNVSASAVTATVSLYRAAESTAYSIVTGKSIAAGDYWRCDFPIQMLDGDKIKVIAGAVSSLDCLITISEGIGRGG